MEEKLVTYKDLECKLIIEDSKKYLIAKKIVNNENESDERLIEKAKEYGFVQAEEGWKLRVYNCFEDYEIDKGYNLCRGESVGKFVLSESETIYAFQMEMHYSRFWQITYEEYINYKEWENDKEFIKELTATRPYLEPYFSRNDLFKIVKQYEREGDKAYFLQYGQETIDIIKILIREKKDKQLKFFQMVYKNLSKVDVDEMNDIFSSSAHLYYNGYISDYEWDRETWSGTLYFSDMEKHIVSRELRDNGANHEEGLKEERDALKSIILEIDRNILKEKIDKAILKANEYINDNIYTEFMNTLIKNYTSGIVAGGCRAYSYSCPNIGDDREKELLKTMSEAEQIEQRLRDNIKKYNIQEDDDAQQQSKDDFLNSYYK